MLGRCVRKSVAGALALFGSVPALSAATLHVDPACPTPAAPFDDWSNAATNIQQALDAAGEGDVVLVTNGTYVVGSQLVLARAVSLVSVNGADATRIHAVSNRCLLATAPATIDGSPSPTATSPPPRSSAPASMPRPPAPSSAIAASRTTIAAPTARAAACGWDLPARSRTASFPATARTSAADCSPATGWRSPAARSPGTGLPPVPAAACSPPAAPASPFAGFSPTRPAAEPAARRRGRFVPGPPMPPSGSGIAVSKATRRKRKEAPSRSAAAASSRIPFFSPTSPPTKAARRISTTRTAASGVANCAGTPPWAAAAPSMAAARSSAASSLQPRRQRRRPVRMNTMQVEDTVVQDNLAGSGGGLYGSGAVVVRNGLFTGNAATNRGGGVYVASRVCWKTAPSRPTPPPARPVSTAPPPPSPSSIPSSTPISAPTFQPLHQRRLCLFLHGTRDRRTGNLTNDPAFLLPAAAISGSGPPRSAATPAPTRPGGRRRRSRRPAPPGRRHRRSRAYETGPLAADFDAAPRLGVAPLEVVLTAAAAGTNVEALAYRWDFQDDGAFDAAGASATNTYAGGLYSVRLVVSNAAGETAAVVKTNWIAAQGGVGADFFHRRRPHRARPVRRPFHRSFRQRPPVLGLGFRRRRRRGQHRPEPGMDLRGHGPVHRRPGRQQRFRRRQRFRRFGRQKPLRLRPGLPSRGGFHPWPRPRP